MKVLNIHLSDFHKGGGGGVSMHRLRLALKKKDVDSTVLCENPTSNAPDVKRLPRKARLEKLIYTFTSRFGLNDIHRVGSFKVPELDEFKNADIINIHGTHHGAFSYLAFPKLSQTKPIVFTMHDMWAFTGHCAQSNECTRWKTGCGQCPYPNTVPAIKRDATHLEWKLKKQTYEKSNISFVTPSSWLTNLAKQSMLADYPIHHIPNGLDLETYQPLDPDTCRAYLGIPKNKKVLMFAAQHISHLAKGGDLLLNALNSLSENLKKDIAILLLGGGGAEFQRSIDIPVYNLDYIFNDRIKAICYSAAHLFVHPTRADNLPIVIQESMACGTPVVSFNVGGVPDLVKPGDTGYLAEPADANDLSQGITQLLEDDVLRQKMDTQCRELMLTEFSIELQADRYINVFNDLLQAGRG